MIRHIMLTMCMAFCVVSGAAHAQLAEECSTLCQLIEQKTDREEITQAIDAFVAVVVEDGLWAEAVDCFTQLAQAAEDEAQQTIIRQSILRSVFSQAGSVAILCFAVDAKLAEAATVFQETLPAQSRLLIKTEALPVAQTRSVTVDTAPDVRPLQLSSSAIEMRTQSEVDQVQWTLDLAADVRRRVPGRLQQPTDSYELHLALLASPCSREQIGSIVAALIEDARQQGTGDSFQIDLFDKIKPLCHRSNLGWMVLALAQDAFRSGNRPAVPVLIEKIDLAAEHVDVRRTLQLLEAVALFSESKQVRARELLDQWLVNYPDGAETDRVLFLLGWSYLIEGENETARTWFSKLVEKYPQSEFAQRARGFLERL